MISCQRTIRPEIIIPEGWKRPPYRQREGNLIEFQGEKVCLTQNNFAVLMTNWAKCEEVRLNLVDLLEGLAAPQGE